MEIEHQSLLKSSVDSKSSLLDPNNPVIKSTLDYLVEYSTAKPERQTEIVDILMKEARVRNQNNKRKAKEQPEGEEPAIKLKEEEKENNKNNNNNHTESISLDEKEDNYIHRNWGEYSDFVIKYQDKAHHVHKFILHRSSKYFVNWFKMHPDEKEVIIQPIESKVQPGVFFTCLSMHRFIQLMYATLDEQIIDIMNLPFSDIDIWQGPIIGICSYFIADKINRRILVAIKEYFNMSLYYVSASHLDFLLYMNAYSFGNEELLITHISKDKLFIEHYAETAEFKKAWLRLPHTCRETILLRALGVAEENISFNNADLFLTNQKNDEESSSSSSSDSE